MKFEAEETITCYRCGREYPKRPGYFYRTYHPLYKGVGYTPYCKTCLTEVYSRYLEKHKSPSLAMNHFCRKLDFYWNREIFDSIIGKAGDFSVVGKYIAKLNMSTHLGKTYDDTMLESETRRKLKQEEAKAKEGTKTDGEGVQNESKPEQEVVRSALTEEDDIEITDDIVKYWGSGFTDSIYKELEARRRFWIESLPDGVVNGVGAEALIRQICALEIDINKDRAEGKPVDRNVKILNELLGSANLKPGQQKDDDDSRFDTTPFGVWIKRWEDERPIPEVDPELDDVDGIVKYIVTWFYGHLAKMLGIKNTRSLLYEQEIEKYRVMHPEYEDDDDEEFLADIFGSSDIDDE